MRSKSVAGESNSARSMPHLSPAGVSGGAAAVRRTASGTPVLVGYLAADPAFDLPAPRRTGRGLPAALVPPRAGRRTTHRTSGKVDREALPWPVADDEDRDTADLGGFATGWLAGLWRDVLGAQVDGPGGLLRPQRRVAVGRAAGGTRCAALSAADRRPALRPSAAGFAGRFLDELALPVAVTPRHVEATRSRPRAAQVGP